MHQVIEKFWARCNGYNNTKKAWLGKQTASQIIRFLRHCHVPRDETDVSVGLPQKFPSSPDWRIFMTSRQTCAANFPDLS